PALSAFGARAGRAAAEYASGQKNPGPSVLAQAKDERLRLEKGFLHRTAGRERLAVLREEMQKTMEESAGIYRTGDSLRRGADGLHGLQERWANLTIEDSSRT